ncbi:MAG: family 2 glycosyl transferase, partial [Chloroflexi bacterium]|nr:family 2 glycosyl transferase [Chloroflexota bacterium]
MMRILAALSHLTAVLALAALTRRLARNLRFLRHARQVARLPDPPPRVSVLVPARDEAATVAACVESLARQ